MGKLFPELAEGVSQKVAAPHLTLELSQSDQTAVPGSRIGFSVRIELPENVHVYAPSVNGYEPIQLELQPSRDIKLTPPTYPAPKILYLEAIKERVPVFEGSARIAFDGTVSASPDFIKTLGANAKTITIAGQLSYQACDKTTCYFPVSAPLRWRVEVLPLDRQRSPEAIRHK
ncbi:MAG: protein-disulfide reductase DsbD domain-containing protein [Terriglobia bacterium]